jgi:hypothetical protein
MTVAIVGLIGVLVGGLLNKVGDAWLARRQQLLTGIAAARLVASEVHELETNIGLMLKRERIEVHHDDALSVDLWHAHRTDLARCPRLRRLAARCASLRHRCRLRPYLPAVERSLTRWICGAFA